MPINQILFKPANLLICLLLLVIASRIPLFYPDRMILDGDEALMGLMSFSQLEYGETPWFFWGQRYGFTLVEASTISAFQYLFGYHDWAIKLAMLFLWLIIVSGMFLFVKQILGAKWAFILVLLFAMHPSWYLWSIKARGGYHTAMLCSAWLFYFLSLNNMSQWLKAALAGIFLALIYHAMKLWFPSAVLITGCMLWSESKHRIERLVLMSVLLLGTWLLLYQLSLRNPDYWKPEVSDVSLFFKNLALLPERLGVFLKGHYFLGDHYKVKELTSLSVGVGIVLLGAVLLLQFLRWKGEGHSFRLMFLLAAMIPLGPLFISNEFFSYRYLLPFPFFLVFWMALQFKEIRFERIWFIGLIGAAVLFSIGSVQITHTEQYKKLAEERIGKMDLAERILADGYHYVFSTTSQTHWQLMYFSQLKIICSGIYYHERLGYIPQVVRDAFFKGELVPVISGDPKEHLALEPGFKPYGIQYILESPDTNQLKQLEFDLYVPNKR